MKTEISKELKAYLDQTGVVLRERLQSTPFLGQLGAGPIKDRLLDYILRGGKNLRPALTRLACEAVGGQGDQAIDVGIAIEITHTWTLVHDDIIDRDDARRNGPSVHAKIREDYADWADINPGMTAEHLAHSMALLVGDAQHAMAMNILSQTGLTGNLKPELALFLISELEGNVLPALLTGEVDDVFQTGYPLSQITVDEILLMLRQKTAALLTFSVTAGGLIGLNGIDLQHPYILALKSYSENLGIAFQLQDDLLGILGDEDKLGKPVGSDFTEGKRTIAVKTAWVNATNSQKKTMERLLGKPDLTRDEIDLLRQLVIDCKGIDRVRSMAEEHIQRAHKALDELPDSQAKQFLAEIADYTINRQK